MNSFTKQLRAGQGAFSRESLEGSDLPVVPVEEVEATLADPVIAEVEGELPAAVADLEEGAAVIAETEDDATTLENTAQILEDAISADPVIDPDSADAVAAAAAAAAQGQDAAATADAAAAAAAPGEGGDDAAAAAGADTTGDAVGAPEDVEPAAAEIADLAIESIARKYSLARPARLSAESFSSAAARIATYRALSKEAFEGAKELRARAAEGLKKLIEWFKGLLAQIFDKRVRLEKRIGALNATVDGIKGSAKADAKIKVGGFGAVMGDAVAADPLPALKEIVNFANELGALGKIAAKGLGDAGDIAEVDVNPKKLGGVTLKYSAAGGKFAVTKEQAGKTEPVEVAPLGQAAMKAVLREAHKALKSLTSAEENFKAIVKGMDSAYAQAKSAASAADGAKNVVKAGGNALAGYQALSKVAASVTSISLAVIANAVSVVEKSAKAYEAPAAAGAADGAAAAA